MLLGRDLWEAFCGRDIDFITRYLESGGDVECPDDGGQTLLHHAAYMEWKDCIVLLVSRGAKVDARDKCARTPLYLVCGATFVDIDIVKVLLEAGADVMARSAGDSTPFIQAYCSRGDRANLVRQQELLTLLIARGAELDKEEKYGGQLFRYVEAPEIAAFMIENCGMDVSRRDGKGRTPLFFAMQPAIVTFLIERGVEVNARDESGATALHSALSKGGIDARVITALLEHGADLNATDNTGRRPIHVALWIDGPRTVIPLMPWRPDVSGPALSTTIAGESLETAMAEAFLLHLGYGRGSDWSP